MKKKREKRNERKTGIQACSASIYFCIEGEQRIDDRESERARKRWRERNRERRQHSITAGGASTSSHHSVCLYLNEKQQ
jgi:hypothetical protein